MPTELDVPKPSIEFEHGSTEESKITRVAQPLPQPDVFGGDLIASVQNHYRDGDIIETVPRLGLPHSGGQSAVLVLPGRIRTLAHAAYVVNAKSYARRPVILEVSRVIAKTSDIAKQNCLTALSQIEDQPDCIRYLIASDSAASMTLVVQGVLSVRRAFDAGDRAQIFVDGIEFMVGHLLKRRPGHDLEKITVHWSGNAILDGPRCWTGWMQMIEIYASHYNFLKLRKRGRLPAARLSGDWTEVLAPAQVDRGIDDLTLAKVAISACGVIDVWRFAAGVTTIAVRYYVDKIAPQSHQIPVLAGQIHRNCAISNPRWISDSSLSASACTRVELLNISSENDDHPVLQIGRASCRERV